MNIVIIGCGAFGRALALQWQTRHTVSGIDSSPRTRSYLYSAFKGGIQSSITTSINDADAIIITAPSHAIPSICSRLATVLSRRIPLICATKGVDQQGNVLTILCKTIPALTTNDIFAMSGPSLAQELASGALTEIVLGGDKRRGTALARELSAGSLLCRATSDRDGIQVLGCYKNIIAILVGIARGCGLQTNTISALVSKAYRELYYIQEIHIHRHTFLDDAGVGDLLVTVISSKSRNNRFGERIGQGQSVSEALHSVGAIVEGYNAFAILRSLPASHPLHTHLIDVLSSIFKKRTSQTRLKVISSYVTEGFKDHTTSKSDS